MFHKNLELGVRTYLITFDKTPSETIQVNATWLGKRFTVFLSWHHLSIYTLLSLRWAVYISTLGQACQPASLLLPGVSVSR